MTKPLLLLALTACSSQESPVTIDINNYNTVESSCCNGCGSCCDGDTADTGDSAELIETCECPEGYDVTPDGDGCVRETSAAATLNGGTPYNVAAGDTSSAFSWRGGVLPDGTADTDEPWITKLNTVGVWAAQDAVVTDTSGNTDPVDEWIGFAVCIEIETAGDYLVGLAGDNRIKLTVDGVEVFGMDETSDPFSWGYIGSSRAPFEAWWMLPVPLMSGKHVIELYGYNIDSVAAFGAEIYGPFDGGALNDVAGHGTAIDLVEADSSLVYFTTGNETVFDLGTDHGYSCPDGYTLDLCGREVVCTKLDYTTCE